MAAAPIRCFECAKVLGDKWETYWVMTGVYFNKELKMIWDGKKRKMSDEHALDELHISRPCCRSVMKTWIQYN